MRAGLRFVTTNFMHKESMKTLIIIRENKEIRR